MTDREGSLWLIVGIVFLAAVAYSVFSHGEDGLFRISRLSAAEGSVNDYSTALHMLRSKNIILGRRQEASQYLSKVETGFYSRTYPEDAQLRLLKEIERIAEQTHLGISRKSLNQAKNDIIGVALEGKTGSEALFRFVEGIGTADIHMKIQRIQIHSLPLERMVNYQVVVSTFLIEKKESKWK